MAVVHSVARGHHTKTRLLVFGLAELSLGYVFFLWATDSGSLLDWFLTIVLVVSGAQNIVKLILKVVPRGHKV